MSTPLNPRLSGRQAKTLVCVIAIIVAAVDFLLPADIDLASFYFVCIILLGWTRSVKWLCYSTAIFVFLTFAGIAFAPAPIMAAVSWVDWVNRSMTALALMVAAVPVFLRLRDLDALERATAERDSAELALRESHTQLEVRVQERSEALLSANRDLKKEVSTRKEAEEGLRRLSLRLLHAQDEEQRRIARELHDSVGQYLAHSKMVVDSWLGEFGSSGKNAGLAEVAENLDACIAETRTISQLLHPPLLDELGFASAARAYVDGFSRRSGIHVNLSMPPELNRFDSERELVLFRILQESLTNALRHAKPQSVQIQLEREDNSIALAVRDDGKGMPPELVERLNTGREGGGVGLTGMRERVTDFGGQLIIQSDSHGTLIRAELPITHHAA